MKRIDGWFRCGLSVLCALAALLAAREPGALSWRFYVLAAAAGLVMPDMADLFPPRAAAIGRVVLVWLVVGLSAVALVRR